MTVITRFAPSPTGYLHTGSARTGLYNFLFARHHGGKYLLRIEDTDKERSTPEATKAILEDLKWLGLEHDGDIVFQAKNQKRHEEVARDMVAKGNAYFCYSTQEEIEKFREANPNAKFRSPWRDKDASQSPAGVKPTIRLKAPQDGATVIKDLIQGEITVENSELDDMIMLRSDGTPTYMLAVVVDDHDMGITHIIRGDDHLTNAFRQKQIYIAMGWNVPEFAHIPLILDKEGKKLSKRKGALGIFEYRNMGYLPEAVNNHLLRLGWGHGDDEIIPMDKAIEWFGLDHCGKSGARFDIDKLNFINAHYMRSMDEDKLFDMISPSFTNPVVLQRIRKGLSGLKNRAHTLNEIVEGAKIYVAKAKELDEKSKEVLEKGGKELLVELKDILSKLEDWNHESIKDVCNKHVESQGKKPAAAMMALRAGVLGTFAAPGIYEVMEVLGKEEVMTRLENNSDKIKVDIKISEEVKTKMLKVDNSSDGARANKATA